MFILKKIRISVLFFSLILGWSQLAFSCEEAMNAFMESLDGSEVSQLNANKKALVILLGKDRKTAEDVKEAQKLIQFFLDTGNQAEYGLIQEVREHSNSRIQEMKIKVHKLQDQLQLMRREVSSRSFLERWSAYWSDLTSFCLESKDHEPTLEEAEQSFFCAEAQFKEELIRERAHLGETLALHLGHITENQRYFNQLFAAIESASEKTN